MSELNWAQPLLGDVAEVIDPHPSHRAPPEVEGGVPFVGIGDLTTSGEVLASSARKVSPRVLDEHKTRYSVALGDIAYGRVATVGKVMRFGEISEPFALSPTMALIKPHGVSASYLAHFLQSKEWDDESAKLLTGTTRSSLGIQLLRKIRISCPRTFEEQTTIGGVLDTLDTAIRETGALIDKLKAVKQGLLHDLLTRGIDANGQLRPPQSEAPQLYKESPLGWIPREWEVEQLGSLLADFDPAMRSGPFGSALLKEELVEVGLPLLGIDNVHTERFVAEFKRCVTPEKFRQLSRYAVRPADLMITIMGTVGRCCLVPDDVGLALSSKHTWTISLDQDRYSPFLAMLQVNYSPWVAQHFARDQQGGTMMAIRSDTLRSLLLPVPARDEQQAIETRLREVGNRIDAETAALEKMKLEKSGLMDDLLTGRVRVTPLLESVQQAAAQTGA